MDSDRAFSVTSTSSEFFDNLLDRDIPAGQTEPQRWLAAIEFVRPQITEDDPRTMQHYGLPSADRRIGYLHPFDHLSGRHSVE